MHPNDKIFVAGHRGLVGNALCRRLNARGFHNVVTVSRKEVDLRDLTQTKWFFSVHLPQYVFMAAAKVGGILANEMYQADFLIDNLRIQNNVFQCAHEYRVDKLLFYGSACAYPKLAEVPVKESSLLCGELEPTNRAYAIAKIAGIEACRAYHDQHGDRFISCMPTNLYGIGDHYDPQLSHVLPGMIRRIDTAKRNGQDFVTLWGTGNPRREFLFADDLADASMLLMEQYEDYSTINIGTQCPIPLKFLAEMVRREVGFAGSILWDSSKPDGTPDRWLDSSRIFSMGWRPTTNLLDGIHAAYQDFLCHAL